MTQPLSTFATGTGLCQATEELKAFTLWGESDLTAPQGSD